MFDFHPLNVFICLQSPSKVSATKTYGNHIIKGKYLERKAGAKKWKCRSGKLMPVVCLNFIGVLLLVVRVCTGKTNNKNWAKILPRNAERSRGMQPFKVQQIAFEVCSNIFSSVWKQGAKTISTCALSKRAQHENAREILWKQWNGNLTHKIFKVRFAVTFDLLWLNSNNTRNAYRPIVNTLFVRYIYNLANKIIFCCNDYFFKSQLITCTYD